MKAFITAVILLFAVTVSVFINSIYASSFYRSMIQLVDAFPVDTDGDRTAVNSACELLEHRKGYLLLTLPENTAGDLFIDFAEAVAYLDTGDSYSYSACLAKVKLRLKMLHKNEINPITELFIKQPESKKRYFP